MSTLTYPAGAPKADGRLLTVDRALKSPKIIEATIVDRGLHFLSDYVFGVGQTGDSGAVVYGETRKDEAYPARGDSEVVEPGSEYPLVDIGEESDLVAVADKFGAGYVVTDEARDRNDTSIIARGNIKLRNVVLRQDARRVVKAFRKAVEPTEGDPWTNAKVVRAQIVRAKAAITALELGYAPDTIIVNPETYADVTLFDDLLTWMPRENKADNPLFSDELDGLFGLHWVQDSLVSADEAIITTSKTVGTNYVEKEFNLRVVREETRDRSIVVANKRAVPVVTDPYAATILTGLKA